jgi:diamine N-acetyltransferase
VHAVTLRELLTAADRESVAHLRRAEGQERHLGSMASHFEDADDEPDARPRMWAVHDAANDRLVGFAMISDGIDARTLQEREDLVGPYYLWRLLVDASAQGEGYGRATIAAVVEHVRTRPDAEVLLTSCIDGPGSPLGFYLRCGFVDTGTVVFDDEVLLSLDLHSA